MQHGEKDIRTLTMPHLNIFINSEWITFIKKFKKEAHDHHAEAMFNQSCQLLHDGYTLVNKEKYQYF